MLALNLLVYDNIELLLTVLEIPFALTHTLFIITILLIYNLVLLIGVTAR